MPEQERFTVLVVDDTISNLDILLHALEDSYEVMVATDGIAALEAARDLQLDLILLDIVMPGLDGYEVCRRLKASARHRDTPVIFLSALDEVAEKARGFALGAVDYITKPFEVLEVQARVKTHLALVRARRELAGQNELLEQKVLERTRQLAATQEVTIRALAGLAETRDNETGGHILRTQHYVKALLAEMQNLPEYAGECSPEAADLITRSAPLHDIGKVGTPDSILLKPGRLAPAEFEVMKKHAGLGAEALELAMGQLEDKSQAAFLDVAVQIARSHHERWDGKGYPMGLAGEAIPLPARLMAIADVYDALVSERIYKKAMSHEEAVAQMAAEAGKHFDPKLVGVFLAIADKFREIALRFADSAEQGRSLEKTPG